MFLNISLHNQSQIAVIEDSGKFITYGELCECSDELKNVINHRTLVFILSENCLGSLIGFTSFLNNHVVPLILSCNTDIVLYHVLKETYKPEYIWLPIRKLNEFDYGNIIFEKFDYCLIKTQYGVPEMNEELSMLLPTSGSTGSPKLIRHSYRNIEANAKNVKNIFYISSSDRPMASLPMHYTMGLSVICSHLYSGATILLCKKSLLDSDFWKMLKEQHATCITGVPYSFELLSKLRFCRKNFPDLKIITQGGGKLSVKLWREFTQYALNTGKQFIATYGQSECTARMAYLPAELALTKECSIGIAEPGGQLSLLNENGVETFYGEDTGELIYRGENVTLGYATSMDDLKKGDENNGIMHTGDIARRDVDGCYYIIGRKKRFLKIYGLRIGLDEIENLIRAHFDVECYCTGDDEHLLVKLTDKKAAKLIPSFIENKTQLFHERIIVEIVDTIKRNESGKIIKQ